MQTRTLSREKECNGEHLLTECKNLSKPMNLKRTSEGHHVKTAIRSAIFRKENDKEIKALLEGKSITERQQNRE